MRILAVLFSLICSSANATIVTGGFVGIIDIANNDAAVLFNISGSAVGATLTGTYSYDTAMFNAPYLACAPNCQSWDSTTGSMQNGTVTMTETVNGVTLTWSGVYYNALLLAHSPAGGNWQYGYWTQAFQLVSENNTQTGADAAQINFGMLTNTADLVNQSLDPTGPFDFGVKQIEANASNWGTAQWSFHTIGVPEPSTISLAAVALMGLFAGRKMSRKRRIPAQLLPR